MSRTTNPSLNTMKAGKVERHGSLVVIYNAADRDGDPRLFVFGRISEETADIQPGDTITYKQMGYNYGWFISVRKDAAMPGYPSPTPEIIVSAVLNAAHAAQPAGAPSAVLYAALDQATVKQCSFEQFDRIITCLVYNGKLRRVGECDLPNGTVS
jgi:hypothetical protein